MALRWKKDPKETGLRAIGAGPRGSTLREGDKEYAHVSSLGGGWQGGVRGWYFTCGTDAFGEYVNTCNNPAPDEKTAKRQAMELVKSKIKEITK